MLIGSIVLYSQVSAVFGGNTINILCSLFEKQNNDDFAVQIMFAFLRFSCHGETRIALLTYIKSSKLLEMIVKYSGSQNQEISSVANCLLEVLCGFDNSLQEKIKGPRFIAYNEAWLNSF